MKNKKIMIYAEVVEGETEASYYELLSKTMELFQGADVKIAALVPGCRIEKAIGALAESGADVVYGMDSEKLAIFNIDYYAEAALRAVRAFQPDILLIPASSALEELAPTLGVRLMTGVAAHCADLAVADDGQFVQMVPAFGGKVIGEILTPNRRPQIASVKPGMFLAAKQAPRECKVEHLDASILEKTESKITAKRVVRKEPRGIPLEKARVVVCGGYGVGNSENRKQIEKLATLLGGAVGYTRPALDQGRPEDDRNMIGTSGKTVRPDVYIGVGVSGAAHHVCGMKDAGVILNINTDEDAEIFKVSDYKITRDGAEIVEALCDLMESDARFYADEHLNFP